MAAAIVGVVGLFGAAAIALAFRRWEVRKDRDQERIRVTAAIAVEIRELLKDFEGVFTSPRFQKDYDDMIAKAGRPRNFTPLWVYAAGDDVYREHIAHIGLLSEDAAAATIRFYGAVQEINASIDAIGKPIFGQAEPSSRQRHVREIYAQIVDAYLEGRVAYWQLKGACIKLNEQVVAPPTPAPPPD